MKTKKLLSILLALMMMLSVVPMYASAAEALSTSNVTQWPTLTYNNPDGKMYFGQTLGEAITINDDEIVTDASGNQVAGHFEFIDPALMPDASTSTKAHLQFVPDDANAYSGFQKKRSVVTYAVEQTTLVLIDENNPPIVEGAVEQGVTLSSVKISGGQVKNPYNATEENAVTATWYWTSPKTVITESGEYEAKLLTSSSYADFKVMIQVNVGGSAAETTITEAPTATLTYGATWNDVILEGGKAMVGDTEVAGTFTLDYTDDTVMNVGTYNLAITFTPNDTENYLPSTGTATVTVNPAPIKFVDENGAEIVPEITVPYGTKFGERTSGAGNSLRQYLSQLDGILYFITFVDSEGNAIDSSTLIPVGINEYKVKVAPQSNNYEATELTCKFTVEATDVKVNILALTDTIQVRKANNNDPTPAGTFAIYVDGQLLKDGVKHNNPVEWNPTVSKLYTIKAVYTPIENDPINVEDVTITIPRALERKITYSDNILNGNPSYLCGATVTIKARADAETFEGWVITDANGNAVDLGVDLTATNITFTMPDFDLNIEAKEKATSSGGLDIDGIFGDMGDLTEGDSEWAIINIIRNIIAKFKSFLQQLIETFQSIGG